MHPYRDFPDKAFWNRAVSNQSVSTLSGLFDGMGALAGARISTAGSCFAQHIGRALRKRGLGYLDLEPAPPFLTADEADRLGYGVYSCRYGNIYTVRQLLQLFQEAHGERTPAEGIWTAGGRHFDALRPGLQPDGFATAEEARALRRAHLAAVREMFARTDIFVFTLGLTEAWQSLADGTVYPLAPGVIAGEYDPARYGFVNFRYPEIRRDFETFLTLLRRIRPGVRVLLTVSPVPLAATASGDHVLVATTQSKATLRAVAGDLAAEHEGVFYFPSYEVITGQPTRHAFYAPDLRNVVQAGVDEVMRHFFADAPGKVAPAPATQQAPADGYDDDADIHCEEALLGKLT